VIHVTRKQVTPDEPGTYVVEASTLGLAPGRWPLEMTFGPKRTRMVLLNRGSQSALYGSMNLRRNFNLIVWND
jgi:hypothetical protein